MIIKHVAVLLIISVCAVVHDSALAESEVFLCIPEIPGGTVDARNPDCIDVKSMSVDFSLDATFASGAGDRSLSAPKISPFSIVKLFDKSSVRLSAAVVRATQIEYVLIRVFEKCDQCDPPENPFLVYKLEDVVLTRHNLSNFEGSAGLSEILDISFGKISMCGGYDNPEGQLICEEEFGWNLLQDMPL